jgi:Fur family peroxide stress response transcriptional regulator
VGKTLADTARADAVARVRRLCREQGFALTPQRLQILDVVLGLEDHPSADEVHHALARRHPRVSRATVFRTLESFTRLGVLKKASHASGGVRYDGRCERHHHLVCVRCDRIVDFSDERLDAVSVPDTRRFGFRVLDLQVELRGICRQCREQEDKK